MTRVAAQPEQDDLSRRCWPHALAVIAANIVSAAILCWPAFLNHLPLIFPDDSEYLVTGKYLVRIMRGDPFPLFMETRSEIYSLSLWLLDRGRSVWPIVAVQALLTAWIIWLVARSLLRKNTITLYLSLMGMLSLFTGIGWYASYLMPDILGPLVYLSFYLLVFALEMLDPWEKAAVALIACWSVTAHGSHLLVATGLCTLLWLLWCIRWKTLLGRTKGLQLITAILLAAVFSQMLVHKRVYGRASVFGMHPAFLTARLLADGPERRYLQQHCATEHWQLCSHVNHLPVSDYAFLWEPQGIWITATPAQQAELRHQEMSLAWATLKAYPLQQASQSLANFWAQLTTIGPDNFAHDPYYTESVLNVMMPGLADRYKNTLQSRDAMPQALARSLQTPTIILSVSLIAMLLPWLFLRSKGSREPHLQGLALIVLFVVPGNAFVTGVLSGTFPRYQGRVVWLLAMLAILAMMRAAQSYRHS